jgi:tRNA (guanine-N7-)-methyltransferase
MSSTPTRKIYGRQKGRPLKESKKILMDTLLPTISYAIGEVLPAPFFLEIGFGGGEHIAFQAKSFENSFFLGCEPFINGVGSLLHHIDSRDIQNIKIHHGDARDVLDHLPLECLDGVFILFPDPWPKARHNKRRIINPDTLKTIVDIMKVGSFLRVASDHHEYATWILEHLELEKRLNKVLIFETGDNNRPENWPQTRYELKGLKEGRPAKFFIYEKKHFITP